MFVCVCVCEREREREREREFKNLEIFRASSDLDLCLMKVWVFIDSNFNHIMDHAPKKSH